LRWYFNVVAFRYGQVNLPTATLDIESNESHANWPITYKT
jgi:hypothetical protein